MGAPMAIVATLEFAYHLLTMWSFMTDLAFRDKSMLVGMAEDTLKSSMFIRSGFKRSSNIVMTGTAISVGNISAVGKLKGLVNLVTLDAIRIFLDIDMRIVAVHAVGFVFVFIVAEGTVDFRMSARMYCDFIYLC